MSLNKCTEFTAFDGVTNELCSGVYHLFSDLDALYDDNSLILSDFSFSAVPITNKAYADQNPIKLVNLSLHDKQHKSYYYKITGDDISCFCELLLFIVVNFEITKKVEDNLLAAMTLYNLHFVDYRFEEEMNRLFSHLAKKPGTKSVIHLLYNAWHENYGSYLTSLNKYL